MNMLPEISEADATGDISALYETIRAETGSTLVNYIWRHLATIDGAAHWAWEFTRLNDCPELAYEIGQNADLAALQTAQIVSPDIPIALDSDAQAILKVYNDNNVANLARVALLRCGLRTSAALVTDAPPPTVSAKPKGERLPALPDYSDLSAGERELIKRLAAAGPAADSKIIPSLWRHLTVQSGLLTQLSGPLEIMLASNAFRRGFTEVRERALSAAAGRNIRLPGPINFDRTATLDGLDRFSDRLAEFTIAGRVVMYWSEGQSCT